MNPDAYDDRDGTAGESPADVADWPPGKPGRPYGIYDAPPGLVRDPSVSLEQAARPPAVRASRELPATPAAPADAAPPASPPASPQSPQAKAPRPRQERFCQMFAVTGNATEAAYQAGYSFPSRRNQGYRLLRRPEIQARVAEVQRDLARAINLDAETMIGKLESIYRQAIGNKYFNAATPGVLGMTRNDEK